MPAPHRSWSGPRRHSLLSPLPNSRCVCVCVCGVCVCVCVRARACVRADRLGEADTSVWVACVCVSLWAKWEGLGSLCCQPGFPAYCAWTLETLHTMHIPQVSRRVRVHAPHSPSLANAQLVQMGMMGPGTPAGVAGGGTASPEQMLENIKTKLQLLNQELKEVCVVCVHSFGQTRARVYRGGGICPCNYTRERTLTRARALRYAHS